MKTRLRTDAVKQWMYLNPMAHRETLALNRRSDPNYVQVSGYLPKELVLQFKQILLLKGLSVQEGLEEAVRRYVEEAENRQQP